MVKKKKIFNLALSSITEKIRIFLTNLFSLLNINFFNLIFNRKIVGKKDSEGLLIINFGDLGDLILSINFIMNCIQHQPISSISYIIKHDKIDLFRNFNINLIPVNKNKFKYNFFYKLIFIKRIRTKKYYKLINLTPERSILAEEIIALADANEKYLFAGDTKYVIAPFKAFFNRFYTHIINLTVYNEYEKLILIASFLKLPLSYNNNFSTGSEIDDSDWNLGSEYICISPFSSDKKRNWNFNNYVMLCERLSKNYNIVLIGTQQQRKLLTKIAFDNVINLAGKTQLYNLSKIIKNCRLFIGNDSGLTHLALLFNKPLVAIIGGGNYGRFFPSGMGKQEVYHYHQLDCFGCDWRCINKKRYCIELVAFDTVLNSIEKLLQL